MERPFYYHFYPTILHSFLPQNYNIVEKPYNKPRRVYGQTFTIGEKVTDVCLLHSEKTSREWVTKEGHQQLKTAKIPFAKPLRPPPSAPLNNSIQEQSNNSTLLNTTLNNSFFESKMQWDQEAPIPLNPSNDVSTLEPKTIYNNAIDAITLTGNRRGFLNTKAINLLNSVQQSSDQPIVGIYCVRWRRKGEKHENESKFVVNCVDIIEAPLNLYCYLDEKMYVKVPMTLTIQLKNTTNTTIHLKSYLKNADNFMFAGHSQVNYRIFFSFFLSFNCPFFFNNNQRHFFFFLACS